jgi:hypothetical protein
MTTMKLPFPVDDEGNIGYIEPGDGTHPVPTQAELDAAPSAGRVPPGVLARVHDEWVLAWADKIPAPAPDAGEDASAFHVDLNATPEAMADFDRRLAEAMKAPG